MPRDYVRVQWTVETKRLEARLRKLRSDFKASSDKSLEKVGELGKTKAQQLAPRDTGVLVRNIHQKVLNGNRVVVFANNPFGRGMYGTDVQRYPRREARRFNLVKFFHKNPGYARTGTGDFMYKTAAYLRRVAPQIVTSEFNKVIIRNK